MPTVRKIKIDPSDSLHLKKGIERYQRAVTTGVVLPVTSLLVVSYYLASTTKTLYHDLILGAGISVTLANTWLANISAKSDATPHWHSNKWNAARWIGNLSIFCLLFLYGLQPPMIVTAMTWSALVISAQVSMIKKSNRAIVTSVGLIAGTIALVALYPTEDLRDRVYGSFAMGITCFLFAKIQEIWTSDLSRQFIFENTQEAAKERLAAAERNAQIGMQVRTISHELGNLIQVLELNGTSNEGIDHQQLARSLYFIKRINKIVLRDIDRQLEFHDLQVKELLSDISLLIRPEVLSRQIRLEVGVDDHASHQIVRERTGSLFLIIQNLTQNALHAIEHAGRKPYEGAITISFKISNGHLKMVIADNGVGLSTEDLHLLLQGQKISSPTGRHGLGFGFVLDEGRRNGIQIEGESVPLVGTSFTLTLPIIIQENIKPVSSLPCDN